ncbi:UDP-N-acetylmuramoyl-L-alanine--D-glutamate ligase [Gemella sp. GH3]|uniref:UDP-N-acetylmuramoyl-L-alanine--D-glutamate ligase n=1 Tax=unclassified Gemella TaxID=2624949 RepID=UPI0015D00682|nr:MULTISPECIES: UDP-N-acetylmuramoyl-L-alanine--D-glutamate ligase [unclassified Gemella]MBF0714289.1 UDP-N-acetylmuramoyl-L-alanine--D-glutamate ligase [Gemella sp. GH3.1]NYS51241.1 UDP-N-acetylmuramoyl-L-alanine--D-glutamate ligase [Gemella sp. GH3]
MNNNNNNILEELKNKNILILGFARSGYKSALILNKLGINVTVNAADDLSNNEDALYLESLGVSIISGGHPIDLIDNVDLIIKNPGIPYKIEFLKEAINRNIEIITEVELASILYDYNILAITGTNGKTTTTTMLYEILKLENENVKLAGNIGYPAIEVAYDNRDNSSIVMEISSFQLNGVDKFRPHIATITNLGVSHLDYHNNVEEYHNIKKRIFKNQTEEDYLILNIKDKELYLEDDIKSKVIYYSTFNNKEAQAYVEDGILKYDGMNIFDVKKLSLPGEHNLENAITASLMAILENASVNSIQKVLYNFKGVKHRLQFLGTIDGIKYYNDSKATNPSSTLKALSGFDRNVILICGGQERSIDLSELESGFNVVKELISIGETKDTLYNLGLANDIPSHKCYNVEEATELATKLANKGDVILLSPACASWDQYKNFEVRGQEFIDTYNKIKKELI